MSRTILLLIGTALVATSTWAATYMRVEKDGTKTYSDRPLPGGQEVVLQNAQSYEAPPAAALPSSSSREAQALAETTDVRYSCEITPRSSESFTNPEQVDINVNLRPPLRPGHSVALTVDGQRVGGPATTSYTLAPAYRGTHSVSVQVTGSSGQVLCQASSSFNVFRPSLNSPRR